MEKAEDSHEAVWQDLMDYGINTADMVIGIAASGTTPYVLHGLRKCNEQGIMTACICCNSGSPVAKEAQLPIECGRTRIRHRQHPDEGWYRSKLILNMISTSVMIKLAG